jgi:hypothetical protein
MLGEGSETGLDSSLGLVEEGREVRPAQGAVASRIGLASALSKAAEISSSSSSSFIARGNCSRAG